jgi:hypothetical protein
MPGKALGVAMSEMEFDSVTSTSVTTGTLTSTGTTALGNASTDLIAFHGAAPVDQAAAITAVGTSIPVAACAAFGLTSTQLTAIITGLNSVITALQEKGLLA